MVVVFFPLVVAIHILYFVMRSDLSDKGYKIPWLFSYMTTLGKYQELIKKEKNPVFVSKYRRTWFWYWALTTLFTSGFVYVFIKGGV